MVDTKVKNLITKRYLNLRIIILFSFGLICLIYSFYCYFSTMDARQVYVITEYQPNSLRIVDIQAQQAGYLAGLRLNDTIVKIDNQNVDTYLQQHSVGIIHFRGYPYFYYPDAFYHWPYSNGQQLGVASLKARYLTITRPGQTSNLTIDLDSFSANADLFLLTQITLFIALVFLATGNLFLFLRPSMAVTQPLVISYNLIAVLFMSQQISRTELNPLIESFGLIASNFVILMSLQLLFYFPNKMKLGVWLRSVLIFFYIETTICCVFSIIANIILPGSNLNLIDSLGNARILNYLALSLVYLVVLIYRYVSCNGADRLRMRVLTLALSVSVLYVCLIIFGNAIFGWFTYTITYEFTRINFISLLIPLVLVYSILRHNLFFADFIVRTSLTYSLLSLFLGVIYFAINNVLSYVINHKVGASNGVIGFISMLVLAIGVSKTKNLSQYLIDKAFYRVTLDYPHLLSVWSNRLASDNTSLHKLIASLKDLITDFQYSDLALLFLEASNSDKTSTDYLLSRAFSNNGQSKYDYGTITVVRGNLIEKTQTEQSNIFDSSGLISFLERAQLTELNFSQNIFSVKEAPQLVPDKNGFVETLPSVPSQFFDGYQFLILFSSNTTSNLYGGLLVGNKLSKQLPTPLERNVLQIITNQMGQSLLTAIKVQEQAMAHQIIHELLIDKDTIVEQERISFSNELHDVIKQTTVALSNTVNTIIESDEIISTHSNLIKNLKIRSDLLLEQTQALLERIRSGVLIEMGGLEGLVKGLDDTMLEVLKLQPNINFSFDENFEIAQQKYLRYLTTEQNMHITRIVKQAIENALRHGQATEIAISMAVESAAKEELPTSSLIVTVRDNGQGFAIEQYDFYQMVKNKHIGLQGMRERAKKLGGTTNVESAIGKGTTITITVPLKEAAPLKPMIIVSEEDEISKTVSVS